jgi:hypothetical protein
MCTITVGNVRTKIQPQRRLDSYNFGATDFDYTTASKHPQRAHCLDNCRIFCLDKRIRFQTGSIVSTIAARKVATKVSRLSLFLTASYCSIVSTNAFRLVATKLRRSSGLDALNYCSVVSCDYSAATRLLSDGFMGSVFTDCSRRYSLTQSPDKLPCSH